MPQTTTPLADETPSDLAARTLGDASLFREILGLNASFNINPFIPIQSAALSGTITDAEILVPLKAELASRVQPALTSVRTGVESALRYADSAIAQVEKYAGIADSLGLTALSSEVNGVLGPAKNLLGEGQKGVTEYGSEAGAIKLVDWLLG